MIHKQNPQVQALSITAHALTYNVNIHTRGHHYYTWEEINVILIYIYTY